MQMPDYAGLVQYRRARSTGTIVGVYRNAEAALDDDCGENPWSTVCEPHGGVVSHRTRSLAEQWSASPEEWCPTCQKAHCLNGCGRLAWHLDPGHFRCPSCLDTYTLEVVDSWPDPPDGAS